ncbi:glycerol dehydrogenase [Neisseria animaloris]|uniref:glycerol dehydrogenase n=1 Tax=Neisseria animaloris TaxID=326522 RepID=UPI0039DF6B78
MATVKSITSPMKFLIQAGLLGDLGKHIKQYGNAGLIICDPFILEKAKTETRPSLEEHGLKAIFSVFGGESSDEEIERQKTEFGTGNCEFVVGIGGGKTLDTAKAVAYYQKVPVVIFPTLASTDAPCTALTVIYNPDGSFNRYLFLPNNPDAVLADTKLLAAEPARFFAAGVGDGLATYFEARTCYVANGINLVLMQPSLTGLGIAKMCYETIRDYAPQAMSAVAAKSVTPALERTIEATIYMSGVGAESGGLAAAHAIHNGMTAVHDLHGAMHGEKVAFGLVAQLVLEGAPTEELEEVIGIIKAVGLPLTLKDLGLKEFKEAEWHEVAKLACAEGETIHNEPFKVTPDMVYDAIVAADKLLQQYR